MIGKIISYEMGKRFKHWTTLLFFFIIVFQGIWYTKGAFDQFVNEGLLMNSPAVFYKCLAAGGMLMLIIIAIITGTSLFKDIQYKTAQWMYTLPIHEKSFYVGRFSTAFFYNISIAFGYVIGMLLVPYSGIGEAHRFGTAPLGQLLHGFLLYTIPNIFLLTSAFFFALVYTRKMSAGYLTIFIISMFFIVMQTSSESGGITKALTLLDPFGYVATDEILLTLPVNERNTAYIPFSGNLLLNRLIWFSIALTLAILSYFKFSFKHFGAPNKASKKPLTSNNTTTNTSIKKNTIIPKLSFSTADYMRKLWFLSRLEFKNIVRPASFKIILGIVFLMIILQNLFWNATYYIGHTMPLTSTMTMFRLAFGFFILILIMIWSGEIFFKDRVVHIHTITDTLPVPVWVTQISRFIAISGMSLILSLCFTVIGMGIQIVQGGVELIELDLYLYDNLGYNWGWLSYLLWIALVFFLSGLTGNRFLTHVLSIGSFFFMILSFELGLAEQTIFAYAGTPGLEDYSEISNYGIWYTSAIWYFLMWLALAVVFVLLGIYFWQRGTTRKWKDKLRFKDKQLSFGGKLISLVALIVFFTIQSFIVKQVELSESFQLSFEEEEEQADYEKKYGYLKNKIQPKYANIDLVFDFYPEERKAKYTANMLLVNTSKKPIDTLFLNYKTAIYIKKLQINGGDLKLLFEDKTHDIKAYQLPEKMAPSDSVFIVLKAQKKHKGFTQSGEEPQPDLMYNGSFGNIHDFLPIIGYNEEKELKENRKRMDQGLSLLDARMAKTTDIKSLNQSIYASDANRVTGKITISTSENQVPLAPGKMINKWTKNNRNYRTYSITKGVPFNWYLGSGHYKEYISKNEETTLKIYASPKHQFNIKLYQKALRASINFVSKNLGNYPFKEIRLHEIPYYQDKFYTYANSIAVSEKEGWYADITNIKERSYIFQSVTSQVITHWIQENMHISNVRGGNMLSKALPEALGLILLKKTLGNEALEHILKKKKDFYAKEKNNEANTEPILLYADNMEYLEPNKGALILFKTIEYLNFKKFLSFLNTYITKNKNSYVTFEDFYTKLKPQLSQSLREEIETK
ncbi:hypothetical protein [Tenacibaculum sp. nBUS_03]|uniref:hypothetical protein n=1 Tax=Tenacibaculum sp. nBUS_03 TaxID=3395320 RepID=UPI003EBDDC6F